MADKRKAWKSTEDNPYYSVYGAEKLPRGLRLPENNVVLLEDCAERRAEWQSCLKKIEGPENEMKTKFHNCNEYMSRYKFCIASYKTVSSLLLTSNFHKF